MDDTKELLLNLIENARAGEHTKFEQLRYFDDYISTRMACKATKKVILVLEESADNLFNTYCKLVSKQQADVNMLLAYKQIQQAVNFYQEEVNIVEDILEDYENYLRDGNFLKAFLFGEERDIWNIR